MNNVDWEELYVDLAAGLYCASGALNMPKVWMDFLHQAANGGTARLTDNMFPLMPEKDV